MTNFKPASTSVARADTRASVVIADQPHQVKPEIKQNPIKGLLMRHSMAIDRWVLLNVFTGSLFWLMPDWLLIVQIISTCICFACVPVLRPPQVLWQGIKDVNPG